MGDEAAFTHLLEEWHSIGVSNPSVADWGRRVDAMTREMNNLRERGEWVHGRDDFFGVLSIHRAEIRHSTAIAWLLDPCARHGLGTRVLSEFLRRLFPDEMFPDLSAARTTCEVVRGDCRADIVITLTGVMIIVENKVDAPESPKQCDILFERFADHGDVRFVLLTPRGNRPATASGEAAEAFTSISYGDFWRVLADALTATKSDRGASGRHIAEDYLRTLEREFHELR